jgi:uncharacterized integral membrane protein
MQDGDLMKTFLDIFVVWPLKIMFFLFVVGAIVIFAMVVLRRLNTINNDVQILKSRMFKETYV